MSDLFPWLGLTTVLAVLLGLILFAMLRFGAATRGARRQTLAESLPLTGAVEEAISRLREQGREMRQRAEESERVSHQIVTSMTSGLLLIDVSGAVQLVNPAGAKILGVNADGSRDYRSLLENAPQFRDIIEVALRDGRPVLRQTIRCTDPRGDSMLLGLTVSPVVNDKGQLQSVICLFNDLTGVLALEEQLRLKDSLARLGELTAGIAHEFRNGLATIHGYSRLMDPDTLPSELATCVRGIRAESIALGQVVTNFLNFAKPAPLTLSDVEMAPLIGRLADEMQPDMQRRGGRIDVEGMFPDLEGDEVLLRQALSNLIRNASEACSTGTRPPVISITGEVQDSAHCRIVIADNGPGIDPGAMERIFQPFFTTRSSGTGLGLALVQKIVVTHNGRIAASNGLQGAAFEVTLPLRQPARAV